MTLTTNIKGYINWNEWGVYEPAPSLLTYEDLIALGNNSAVLTELNKDPEWYYNALNESWHIHVNNYNTWYYLRDWISGNPKISALNYYRFFYSNQTRTSWSWTVESRGSWWWWTTKK